MFLLSIILWPTLLFFITAILLGFFYKGSGFRKFIFFTISLAIVSAITSYLQNSAVASLGTIDGGQVHPINYQNVLNGIPIYIFLGYPFCYLGVAIRKFFKF